MLFLSYYTIRASLHKHMRTSFRQILPQEHIPQDEFGVIGNDNVIPCCFGEHEMSAEEGSAAFAAKRR